MIMISAGLMRFRLMYKIRIRTRIKGVNSTINILLPVFKSHEWTMLFRTHIWSIQGRLKGA
jgi:hypothetical protein